MMAVLWGVIDYTQPTAYIRKVGFLFIYFFRNRYVISISIANSPDLFSLHNGLLEKTFKKVLFQALSEFGKFRISIWMQSRFIIRNHIIPIRSKNGLPIHLLNIQIGSFYGALLWFIFMTRDQLHQKETRESTTKHIFSKYNRTAIFIARSLPFP